MAFAIAPATVAASAALACLVGIAAIGSIALLARFGNRIRKHQMGDAGNLKITGVFTIVGVILAATLAVIVVARLFPTYADAIADLNENMTSDDVTFGDETADGLKPVMAIVIGLAGLFGIIGIVVAAVHFRGKYS